MIDGTQSVLANARFATFVPGLPYGLIDRGALAAEAGRIRWVGPWDALPAKYASWPLVDLGRRLATPALIDCHTHIVFGGHRAREFEMRLTGASYEEIARTGGGIRSTVSATRQASEDDLLDSALPRVDALVAEGVATLEVKSGYGLDVATERRMLRVARRIGELRDVTVRTTYLGAHALPPEYENRPDAYIDFVAGAALPALAADELVDAVDAFCESIAFSPAQVAKVFDTARELDLAVKIHAEQLSNLGGGRGSRRVTARYPQTIWSISISGTLPRSPMPGPSRCSFRAPSIFFARRRYHRFRRCATLGSRWRSPRTVTPGPRRSYRFCWPSTWPVRCSG